ncbi:penicillin-binding protein activator [Marinomonas algarum]|uniref:Penicillin-binding protein activator n=1 Tax=Marinomonas algarum TaxID=2883105 RepID=A0A9X1LB85_9GAMM|nr:penicillin-binding protein activator [Marinomonas algarum]MCB5160544.1 penicillin-binding protein activator [Marinomonas algarum]
MSRIYYRIISLTLCSFLLSACNSVNLNREATGTNGQTTNAEENISERTLPPSVYHPIKTTEANKKVNQAYQNALDLYDTNEFQQAIALLEASILPTASTRQFDGYLLAALAESRQNKLTEALDYLQQAETLPTARHPDNQNRLKATQAAVLEHVNDWLTAVHLRMALADQLPLNEGAENQTRLWLAIQNLTQNEMKVLYQQQDSTLKGWLDISTILRDQSLSIEQQLTLFHTWQANHPDHPAAVTPPQDFVIMATVQEKPPENIVLLLPMSGPLERASQAIVDGFLVSYYNKSDVRPKVTVVNTEEYANITDALSAANAINPDVIVGPLQKSNVARVSQMILPHPVIALNQLDFNKQNPNLYHFSLSAEDEIHELITFAKQEGATTAAVLSTQDTWALKQSDEFNTAAAAENLSIVFSQSYANTPRGRQQAIQSLLLVDESYARKRSIERWIGSNVDSTARSRKDLDYVYYIGKLNDAKQIRPLLDFYFADKIPMLASSTLNDSEPESSTKSGDIERILFTEVPALLQDNTTLKDLPRNSNSNILRRLQALGADAFLLANKHTLFTLLPNTKIAANTGIITLDDQGIFHKRPEIMTYQKGTLVYADSEKFFESKQEIKE